MKKKKVVYYLIGLVVAGFAAYTLYGVLKPLRINHIELHYLPENRLRLRVRVVTNKPADATLRCWKVSGKDTLSMTPSLHRQEHELIIYNLHERSEYLYQIIAQDGETTVESKIYSFQTKAIYQTTPYLTLDSVDTHQREKLYGKYFLTQILTEPGAAVVINGRGDMVWYEAFAKGVKVSNWTADKTVLCILGSEDIPSSGGDEIVEIDRTGNYRIHFKLGEKGMDKMVHHEVRKDRDGNIYAITFNHKIVDLTTVGGLARDTIKGDGIVLFDPQGNKLWEWSVLDHLDLLRYPNILHAKKDLVHANSLLDDGKGHYLMSFRDLNQVWKIDKATGAVVWRFGQKGDFELDAADQFHGQHYAHYNTRGELMILDNGTDRKKSRALSFVLDEKKMTAENSIAIAYPTDYFSSVKGNATLTKEGYILSCLTDPRTFFIHDKRGHLLWKMGIGGDPYRIEEIDFQ